MNRQRYAHQLILAFISIVGVYWIRHHKRNNESFAHNYRLRTATYWITALTSNQSKSFTRVIKHQKMRWIWTNLMIHFLHLSLYNSNETIHHLRIWMQFTQLHINQFDFKEHGKTSKKKNKSKLHRDNLLLIKRRWFSFRWLHWLFFFAWNHLLVCCAFDVMKKM